MWKQHAALNRIPDVPPQLCLVLLPGIIKYPFWQMTYTWPDATYACINLDEAAAPREIKDRSICINEDVGEILTQLKNR